MESWKNPVNIKNIRPAEPIPGILLRTLTYNKDATLCHFQLVKGSHIPMHDHINTQVGFVISGKLKFTTEKGGFLVQSGDSYAFNPSEKHGAEVLEDTVVIDVFTPDREAYHPKDDQYIPEKSHFL
ncbi:MAG: cupin domain-containing protein [Promethearchaeota archaeon]